ncbi:Mor transcription activator family protein [Pseudazoarcus pumilus]|uniref:Mor transcription activator domain-containing protein n=1 Tax=Pseudazoarcus pumilus TaxID=2067960 RepID=A0A2I6S9G4_9RHOO|nr:Mor transcription activator family protein [Pseudazoarcus pumilus]AUN95894.1 hypothetical protein C0099_13710 [Pseudazoarcus pumilus]
MSKPAPLPAHLPESVIELVEVVGMSAALAIVEARGGIRFYVPVRFDPDHWLSKLVGCEAAQALIDYAAGDEIEVPRCAAALAAARERLIAAEAESGRSRAELARAYGYTERGIRKLLRRAEAREEERQADLF